MPFSEISRLNHQNNYLFEHYFHLNNNNNNDTSDPLHNKGEK